ncbi:MAG TPA: outer membrane protein assembly factor BamC [Gallionella sp.]
MKVLHVGISCAVAVALAACSSTGKGDDRFDYGAKAQQTPGLEVPPDLTVPRSDERFRIPQAEGAASANLSDISKGGIQNQADAVLPALQWVRLERNGAKRWLVVNDNADSVWPVVRAFWLELGLSISSEETAAGVMETHWAENLVAPRDDKTAQAIAGTRDKYLTRLERSKDGASTEIHISHRGIEEVVSDTGSRWKSRAPDTELEAAMLQRLMLRMGASRAEAERALAASAVPTAGTAISDSNTEPAGTASLRKLEGDDVTIVVNDPFDRAWRKVGLALDDSSLAVEDRDREKGIYYLRPIKVERSWYSLKSDEDTDRQYRVNVKDGGKTCEVTITDQDGVSNKAARQMLEALYKNINKQ